jgi:enoyl-CoA hydratase
MKGPLMSDRSSKVLVERLGPTLLITINGPEVRNAIDLDVAVGIAAAVDELDDRDELCAGVITGAGDVFCAGMDLKRFAAGERPVVPRRGFAGLTAQPPAKPLIAAVGGHALAGGFEVALACDMIVASDTAYSGCPRFVVESWQLRVRCFDCPNGSRIRSPPKWH